MGFIRVALVTDIHGNRRALHAVLADLKQVAPDLILHGGDLVFGGTHPAEIIDEARSLGWPGVSWEYGRGTLDRGAAHRNEHCAPQADRAAWTAARLGRTDARANR
jgi:hypothetical protein